MTPTGNRIVTFEKPLEMKVNTFKFRVYGFNG